MKRAVIAVAAVLSLIFAGLAFAAESIQPSAGNAPNFEQMKADHLKRIEDRIRSLQEAKVCTQEAKNQDGLRACWSKHKPEMKKHHDEMRRRGALGSPDGQGPQIN